MVGLVLVYFCISLHLLLWWWFFLINLDLICLPSFDICVGGREAWQMTMVEYWINVTSAKVNRSTMSAGLGFINRHQRRLLLESEADLVVRNQMLAKNPISGGPQPYVVIHSHDNQSATWNSSQKLS